MVVVPDTQSWFGPSLQEDEAGLRHRQDEFERLWRAFMTARVTLGLVLLLLQGTIFSLAHVDNVLLIFICGLQFCAALGVRVLASPRPLGRSFDPQWIITAGVDVLAFAALQFFQGSAINYTPLFALPVLLAAVLGTLPMALGTAASVTLLVLLHAFWLSVQAPVDATPHYIQSALTGAGSFVVAFLAHQLAARLAQEELRARQSQRAARIQQQVNDLVIESLTDGVLVVDVHGVVHAANPAARQMLQPAVSAPGALVLGHNPAWADLAALARAAFEGSAQAAGDVVVQHPGQGPRRMHVRTQLTERRHADAAPLCVMFLQDLRELEARLRTEKLASMGRMSAAVAHEIRNPLAAIVQANALLEEDLVEPRFKQLTQMVGQNAQRLEKIVEEVLNISRVQNRAHTFEPQSLALNGAVARICFDWAEQNQCRPLLLTEFMAQEVQVNFEPEHLRRVLINLLDNARRYACTQSESIQVTTRLGESRQPVLGVWSDGKPMEQSVERHLFEPFFSSESRSSGLGLYICRELCEGHGASIGYQRSRRIARGVHVDGNEFLVRLRRADADGRTTPSPHPPIPLWN